MLSIAKLYVGIFGFVDMITWKYINFNYFTKEDKFVCYYRFFTDLK